MSRQCFCTACGETFSTEANFSLHQGAIAGCDPSAPRPNGEPRLFRDSKGIWRGPSRETPWGGRDRDGDTNGN